MQDPELNDWFVAKVLPLERGLRAFLARNSYKGEEADDLLHDIYERAIIGARRALPRHTNAYVFTIARNLLITRAKRATIVQFQLMSESTGELDKVWEHFDYLTPERHASAREQLKRVMEGLDRLPPRCSEVVRLRKIDGLAVSEIAWSLGISVSAVEQHLTFGMKSLADCLHGGTGRISRSRPKAGTWLPRRAQNDT